MVIAIENGLKALKSHLKDNGYILADYDNCNIPVDVIIYKSIHLKPCSDLNFTDISHNNGILMIYGNNKSFDEIDNILKTWTYGPLF